MDLPEAKGTDFEPAAHRQANEGFAGSPDSVVRQTHAFTWPHVFDHIIER